MIKRKFFLIPAIFLFTVFSLTNCARTMSNQEYHEIMEDFLDEFVRILLDPDAHEQDLDIEDLAYLTLEGVANDRGYNASIFMTKAEELGEDWDDIWARVELRLEEEFEKMMNHMEEQDERFDLQEE